MRACAMDEGTGRGHLLYEEAQKCAALGLSMLPMEELLHREALEDAEQAAWLRICHLDSLDLLSIFENADLRAELRQFTTAALREHQRLATQLQREWRRLKREKFWPTVCETGHGLRGITAQGRGRALCCGRGACLWGPKGADGSAVNRQ